MFITGIILYSHKRVCYIRVFEVVNCLLGAKQKSIFSVLNQPKKSVQKVITCTCMHIRILVVLIISIRIY